jgi:hypothetical protein
MSQSTSSSDTPSNNNMEIRQQQQQHTDITTTTTPYGHLQNTTTSPSPTTPQSSTTTLPPHQSSTIKRYAMLIDAERAIPATIESIINNVLARGELAIKRAYGDFTLSHMLGWKHVIETYGIIPTLQFHNSDGSKSSSDIALIICAMDLLHTHTYLDGFILVTSDVNFTGLCARLREDGKFVWGFGNSQTPTALVNSCSEFTFVRVVTSSSSSSSHNLPRNMDQNHTSNTNISPRQSYASVAATTTAAPAPVSHHQPFQQQQQLQPIQQQHSYHNNNNYQRNLEEIIPIITNLCEKNPDGISLSDISLALRRKIPGFFPENYGPYPTLKSLIKALPPKFDIKQNFQGVKDVAYLVLKHSPYTNNTSTTAPPTLLLPPPPLTTSTNSTNFYSQQQPQPQQPPPQLSMDEVISALTELFGDNPEAVSLSYVSTILRRKDPEFSPLQLGYPTLKSLLKDLPPPFVIVDSFHGNTYVPYLKMNVHGDM